VTPFQLGPSVVVAVGDVLAPGTDLPNDPGVGGFGQLDAEIVLQTRCASTACSPFFAAVVIANFCGCRAGREAVEKVQAAEGVDSQPTP